MPRDDDLIFEVLREAADGELPRKLSGDGSQRSLTIARLFDGGLLDAKEITPLDVVDKSQRSFLNPRITSAGRARLAELRERRYQASWRGRLSRTAAWLGTQLTTVVVGAIGGAISGAASAWIVLRFLSD